MNWAVMHYSKDGFRVGGGEQWDTNDIYPDGWFVDFVGDEGGCREFLKELELPIEFEFVLMKSVDVLGPSKNA